MDLIPSNAPYPLTPVSAPEARRRASPTPSRRRRWTEEEDDRLVALRADGLSHDAIAGQLGCSATRVTRSHLEARPARDRGTHGSRRNEPPRRSGMCGDAGGSHHRSRTRARRGHVEVRGTDGGHRGRRRKIHHVRAGHASPPARRRPSRAPLGRGTSPTRGSRPRTNHTRRGQPSTRDAREHGKHERLRLHRRPPIR